MFENHKQNIAQSAESFGFVLTQFVESSSKTLDDQNQLQNCKFSIRNTFRCHISTERFSWFFVKELRRNRSRCTHVRRFQKYSVAFTSQSNYLTANFKQLIAAPPTTSHQSLMYAVENYFLMAIFNFFPTNFSLAAALFSRPDVF